MEIFFNEEKKLLQKTFNRDATRQVFFETL